MSPVAEIRGSVPLTSQLRWVFRRFDPERRWVLPSFFMGHLPAINDYMESKSKPLRYFNWYMRLYGAPIFLNNPISSLFVILAAFIDNYYFAACGLLGGTVGFFTALVTMKDVAPLQSGAVAFNSFLVGLVVPRFVFKGNFNWRVLLAVAILAVLCVYVSVALDVIFKKLELPTLNLAFNVIAIIFIGMTQDSQFLPKNTAIPLHLSYSNITGTEIGKSILLGVGQTLGFSSLSSGGIVLLAMFIFSPLMCLQAIIATCVGLSTGLAIGADLANVYAGQYGYNAVLCCCSLGGFFLVYGAHTQLLTILAGIFTALLYACLEFSMAKVGLECVTLPFILSVIIFLSAAKYMRGVSFPESISCPEQHLYDHTHNAIYPEKANN